MRIVESIVIRSCARCHWRRSGVLCLLYTSLFTIASFGYINLIVLMNASHRGQHNTDGEERSWNSIRKWLELEKGRKAGERRRKHNRVLHTCTRPSARFVLTRACFYRRLTDTRLSSLKHRSRNTLTPVRVREPPAHATPTCSPPPSAFRPCLPPPLREPPCAPPVPSARSRGPVPLLFCAPRAPPPEPWRLCSSTLRQGNPPVTRWPMPRHGSYRSTASRDASWRPPRSFQATSMT